MTDDRERPSPAMLFLSRNEATNASYHRVRVKQQLGDVLLSPAILAGIGEAHASWAVLPGAAATNLLRTRFSRYLSG